MKGTGRFTDWGQFLVCKLYKYEDPNDHQKYFKISIRSGKDAEKLETMPKEIIFLIDCEGG